MHTTLTATDSRNCHQVASPNPTNVGIANGAVGGREASTLTSSEAWPELTPMSETM
jgi:hypothetical protein